MGRGPRNNWLDLGGDTDHDIDPRFLDADQDFLKSGACLRNNRLDFGGDHDSDPGIFKGFFCLAS